MQKTTRDYVLKWGELHNDDRCQVCATFLKLGHGCMGDNRRALEVSKCMLCKADRRGHRG